MTLEPTNSSPPLILETEYYRALLNLLDDFNMEKERLNNLQRALINILEDIEEERERVDQSKKLLELSNKELEAFSYSVSHDLQAPLRAINGFAQAVVEDYSSRLDAEGKHYLKLIQDNAKQMGQLIQDLLAFSRLGRQQINRSKINMEKLVQDVFEDLKTQFPKQTVRLKIGKLPQAEGDLGMIRQVFLNLLSNALKFSRLQDETIIEVGFGKEKELEFYYVKDNGIGFDMQYIDKLFGVFERLHTSLEFEGTGIGLALVKRIINRHGGKVWAEGKVNQGACFYFTL